MVGKSNQNVFLIQKDASSFAEFEISEFEISRFDCTSQHLDGRPSIRWQWRSISRTDFLLSRYEVLGSIPGVSWLPSLALRNLGLALGLIRLCQYRMTISVLQVISYRFVKQFLAITFLAHCTESRGSYCRTPGIWHRQRQRQRPHWVKFSL